MQIGILGPHCDSNQVEEDEMGGSCSTNGGEEELV
jgi:hypothetical protein